MTAVLRTCFVVLTRALLGTGFAQVALGFAGMLCTSFIGLACALAGVGVHLFSSVFAQFCL